MSDMLPEDLLSSENLSYLEQMQARCREESSPSAWQQCFSQIATSSHRPEGGVTDSAHVHKQFLVSNLINRFRAWGARVADINPLHYKPEGADAAAFLPQNCDLSEQDMETVFYTDMVGAPKLPLRQIMERMRAAYCSTLAPEFMHLSCPKMRSWLMQRFESPRPAVSSDEKVALFRQLLAAELLEKFLHIRYVGKKRFSLEGGDTLIPLLHSVLTAAVQSGVQESVIGMAHRGRLNVLINVVGKRTERLFLEFEEKFQQSIGSGDVKYHLGASNTYRVAGVDMHLALAFNPSHLEIVNPVVTGSVRARQELLGDSQRKQVLPILIHGDASFAGQGVVMETLNLSQVSGFRVGGTVHVIINNQIGFTTSTPRDARSTFFCSDIAKMAEIPVIHVNGDDVVASAYAAQTALAFRQAFGSDIVIDMLCFRRHGHNEQDEPSVTQPFMYQKIAHHPGTVNLYARQLVQEGIITDDDVSAMADEYRHKLEDGGMVGFNIAPQSAVGRRAIAISWQRYNQKSATQWDYMPKQPVSLKRLKQLGDLLSTVPADFNAHPRLQALLMRRREMMEGKRPVDWGMAENLSYATLLEEGFTVRLSGQDCGRGTFSHRHAVWHDQQRFERNAGSYLPLRFVRGAEGKFLVIDSTLSEEGVLAFEYGYSTTDPDTLVIWEAQFGDFANGAQVVIDQFITSSEAKWNRCSGVVLFLPHGYEGQGPEHSSARPERYLQLCAEYNIQVCVPSSSAQIFHLLRRQMLRDLRRPLIVITPKSLLRHPDAASSLDDLSHGHFEPVIGETDDIAPADVRRLVFCCGKVYYDLRQARRKREQHNVAICRLEQLYPFPHDHVSRQIRRYARAKSIVWCQEEPGNQGAWHRIQHYLRRHMLTGQRLSYALRASSASAAVGYYHRHQAQQKEVVEAALNVGAADNSAAENLGV